MAAATASGPLLECVPNFSEGRDAATIDALCAAIDAVDGVRVLDRTADADHHRAVVTFAGDPRGVADAAFRAARVAVERIDLRRHRGVHRRMGALDVCPLVPLGGADMALAVDTARALAERIAGELSVPVFLYARAAARPERAVLGHVRNHGFEKLTELVQRDPTYAPDFGPKRLHPTAGATAVGARPFLIAYNVELETPDVAIARRIAARIRERDGGLWGVQAMGFHLASRDRAQVSTNLLDFARTPLRAVFDRIAELARAEGTAVERSELIGLAPAAALDAVTAAHIRLDGFDPDRQIVERVLARACG